MRSWEAFSECERGRERERELERQREIERQGEREGERKKERESVCVHQSFVACVKKCVLTAYEREREG